MDAPGLTLEATFFKAATTVDGGWRISFDVNPDYAKEIVILSQLVGQNLQLAVVPFRVEPTKSDDWEG